jgi:hypothetical protein
MSFGANRSKVPRTASNAEAHAYPATGQFSLLESAVKNNAAPTVCIAAIAKNRLSIAGLIIEYAHQAELDPRLRSLHHAISHYN